MYPPSRRGSLPIEPVRLDSFHRAHPPGVSARTRSAGEVPVVCTVYHSSAMSFGTASPSRNELPLRTTSKSCRRAPRCGVRTGPRAREWSPHRPVKHEDLVGPTYA